MDDLPKNRYFSLDSLSLPFHDAYCECSAGKTLRIELATRLGIGCLLDTTPALSRHFEAEAPSTPVSLTDPIPCSKVSIDLRDVDRAFASIPWIEDLALRFVDQSIQAFLSVGLESPLNVEDVKMAVSLVLPGYSIPDIIHILKGFPLVRNKGQVDFEILENQAASKGSLHMTKLEVLVCDIFANLLPGDAKRLNRDSDFFLLGGTSLLLGKLSYHIRKRCGASIAITALFNSSTVKDIANLIEEEVNLMHTAKMLDGASTKGYDDYDRHTNDFPTAGFRKQTHPFNLIVQVLPLAFYPLMTALNCECHKGRWQDLGSLTVIDLIGSLFLFIMSLLIPIVNRGYWQSVAVLLISIAAARLSVAILCPLVAIAFKWIVIGTYKQGTYRMYARNT